MWMIGKERSDIGPMYNKNHMIQQPNGITLNRLRNGTYVLSEHLHTNSHRSSNDKIRFCVCVCPRTLVLFECLSSNIHAAPVAYEARLRHQLPGRTRSLSRPPGVRRTGEYEDRPAISPTTGRI